MLKVRNCLSALLCSSLWLIPSTQADAKTLFSKTFSYFSIGGLTATDLDRELSTKGPFASSTGSRHPGETQIKFGGSAKYLEKNGSCRIQDAQVNVVSKIFLPTWKNRNRATPDLALIWDALASDIKRHEERHAEIALQHAKALESTIKALPAETTCAAMRAEVAKVTDIAISEHDRDQQRFDKTEAINFSARMERLITTRMESASRKK